MASSVTWAHASSGKVRRIDATVTFHTDGTFTATACPYAIEGKLMELQTNPGSTAPTQGYEVTWIDADGVDTILGAGQGKHATVSERVPIVYPGVAVHPTVDVAETFTLTIVGNSVNGATTVIRLYYTPEL